MNQQRPDDVVSAYSERSSDYEHQRNLTSCWAEPTQWAMHQLRLRAVHRTVVDVGCGTGDAIIQLTANRPGDREFIGIEPAEQMRQRASERLRSRPRVRVIDGRFEDLPLESDSVDYLYSILAFHWTTDVDRSIAEIARVLKPEGEFDLFFTGRHTGREFTRQTTPIFLKYLGAGLLSSAQKRQHLTAESTRAAFRAHFNHDRLDVIESSETYYDDLDGHWSWWVARTAGHFQAMDQHQRQQCDRDIRQAIAELQEDQGIPYTVHLIHVSLQNREAGKSCD